MKLKLIAILLLLTGIFAACNDNPTTGKRHKRSASLLTPASSGNPYEVMVVADDSVWTGYAGKAIQTILDKPLRGLPQDEPQFHKSHITEKHYDHITNLFRNIFRINIGKEYTQAKMTVEKDLHSTPQMIITVNAPNQQDASIYITEHTKDIESLITSEEINREANDLYFEHNIKFAKKVKEMFDCEFYIPGDIKKMKVGEDFIWASDDGLSTIQNICIYSLPYVSEKMFTKKPYIALRDTVMKRNIPGGKPGQWMQTNPNFVWTKNINVAGQYAMEARGLWEMRNDAMGGPFISHSRIDKKNGRVIVVEGFVYAPEKMKRTMIRRLEAALYTLETPSDEENNTKK
ncbi:MAG: DUF4837 family protein [Bacteroidaceae bacterium]|nr:DUF4837 family protein [Bacteroidaceae bacterium]